MGTKTKKPRSEAGKQRTLSRKAARKAAQKAAEQRNALLRASGKPVPSEELWGDLKRRMTERREVRRQDRASSTWRRLVPVPRVRVRAGAGHAVTRAGAKRPRD